MSEFPTGIQNNASFQQNFNMRKFERNLLVKRQKCNHLFSIHTVFLILLAACGIGHSQNFGPNSGNGLDFWQSERPFLGPPAAVAASCPPRHRPLAADFPEDPLLRRRPPNRVQAGGPPRLPPRRFLSSPAGVFPRPAAPALSRSPCRPAPFRGETGRL